MEIQSPGILKSIDSQNRNSVKSSSRSSVVRYTPSLIQEEKSIPLIDLFQDSLELPRPKSRLLDFQDKENIPDLPRHIRKHSSDLELKNSSISELLLNLRERPKPKSSLKTAAIKKNKTVSFCSQLELSSPDTVVDSVILTGPKQILEDSLELEPDRSVLATTINSTLQESCVRADKGQEITNPTQHGNEGSESVPEEAESQFYFEENVRGRLRREEEFNEYSTIAFCDDCKKETVTQVAFEKIKGSGCVDLTEWIICWMMPACLYRKKLLVHSCSFCNKELMKSEYN